MEKEILIKKDIAANYSIALDIYRNDRNLPSDAVRYLNVERVTIIESNSNLLLRVLQVPDDEYPTITFFDFKNIDYFKFTLIGYEDEDDEKIERGLKEYIDD